WNHADPAAASARPHSRRRLPLRHSRRHPRRGPRKLSRQVKLGGSIARSLRRSPYIPVVTHPVLRRILPGIGLSSIGDGMSTVAISWLALQLASGPDRTTWVAAAVAAYSLPGIVGAVAFTRFLDGRPGAQLAGWDAALRTVFLGVIPVAHA